MLTRRLRQKFVTVGFIPASVILTILGVALGSMILFLTAGGLALVWAGFTLLNWRCPSCRDLLSVAGDVSECEKCGVRL